MHRKFSFFTFLMQERSTGRKKGSLALMDTGSLPARPAPRAFEFWGGVPRIAVYDNLKRQCCKCCKGIIGENMTCFPYHCISPVKKGASSNRPMFFAQLLGILSAISIPLVARSRNNRV